MKKTTKKKAAKKATKKATKQSTDPKSNKKSSQTKKTTQKSSKTTKKTTSVTKTKKKKNTSIENQDEILLKAIIEGMQEKKANNITILDLRSIENAFCNYFVICEAESKPQLQAITDSVEEFTRKKLSIKPHHIEGLQNAEWILIDYLTIVVHIFRSDVRDFYKIENLWADANIQRI
ncbi:MAG: hypothetical protein KatS3mg028_0420 [Bacteroidia bacterium]|nr:MAG: hypothetical protein KatS3mg028_0420 [Bacteroidia bacterium]